MPDSDLEQQVEQPRSASTPPGVPWIEARGVASAYVFLASDAARMVAGTLLDVARGNSVHLAD